MAWNSGRRRQLGRRAETPDAKTDFDGFRLARSATAGEHTLTRFGEEHR